MWENTKCVKSCFYFSCLDYISLSLIIDRRKCFILLFSDNPKETTTAINYVERPRTGESHSDAPLRTYSYTLLLTVFSLLLLLVS